MKKAEWLKDILIPEKKLHEVLELYPGKTREEVRNRLYRELGNRLLISAPAVMIFLLLAWYSGKTETEEPGVLRPAPGGPVNLVQVQVDLQNGWRNIPLEIGALEYEENRIEELHAEAIKYLQEVVPGENESLDYVTETLVFPENVPTTGGNIQWTTDAPWLITSRGEVLNTNLEEAVTVQITAELSYGSEFRFFSEKATVYPAVYSEEEAVLLEIRKKLSEQELMTRKEERFILPDSVLGYRIEPVKNAKVSVGAFWVLLAIIVPFFLYSNYYGSLDTRKKERKEQAEHGYSEFVTKLSLILAAGISVRQVFTRLADDYEKQYGPLHVIAEELKVTKQELDNGRSETVVYEEFGRRIGVLAYRRMASLLTRNVSKGVQDIRNLLLQEAKEVMTQERATIRQKGEQAGTKLLLPMIGLLVLVFAILLVPAFQSF